MTTDTGTPADLQAQNLVVEEREGRVGFLELVQGVGLRLSHVLEEAAHVAGGEVAGVAALVVEQDQPGVQKATRSPGPSWPKRRRATSQTRSSSRGGGGGGTGRDGGLDLAALREGKQRPGYGV